MIQVPLGYRPCDRAEGDTQAWWADRNRDMSLQDQIRNVKFTSSRYWNFELGVGRIILRPAYVIFQLIYTCALAQNTSSQDLEEIALTSRARNLAQNITGILLCKDGSVLQVLEGDKDIVMALFDKIAQDRRATNPLILTQRTSAEREFPNWSMGYRNADETEAAFNLCARSFPDVLPENASQEVGTISRTFGRVTGLA